VLFVCCQFVLQIDEQLFEAFAPRRLKNALAKTAALEAPPLLPAFKGLDIAPAVKLSAALGMVAIMSAIDIAPQAQFISDAGVALCGGSLNWAWDVDKLGFPRYVDMTETVGKWRQSKSKSPPPTMQWFPPTDDTATLPFKARFVEDVLRLGSNSEALISGQNVPRFDWEVCTDSFFHANVSAVASCTLSSAFTESKDRAQALATDSLSDAVQSCARGNFPGRSGCQDNFCDFPLVSTVSSRRFSWRRFRIKKLM
jgi:hypothetical protein